MEASQVRVNECECTSGAAVEREQVLDAEITAMLQKDHFLHQSGRETYL